MKDSFILYQEHKQIFDMLTDEEAGMLIKAIFEYERGQLVELDKTLQIAFVSIKNSLDRNREKWEIEKQKRSEAGKIGGITRALNKGQELSSKSKECLEGLSTSKQSQANQAVNVHVNVHDNVNDNIYTLSEAEASTSGTAKASKHKYGEYKHVLLKDEELQALKRDYANWEELIKYLDEYIEMKGYKAKSHYLAIKKWVVDAVKRNANSTVKTQGYAKSDFGDLDRFYDNNPIKTY